jgi:hypothetical protein
VEETHLIKTDEYIDFEKNCVYERYELPLGENWPFHIMTVNIVPNAIRPQAGDYKAGITQTARTHS